MKIQMMFAIAVLALGAMASAMQSPSSPSLRGGSGEYHTNGPATCNCLEEGEDPNSTEKHTVCASKSVDISVGTDVITVKTGLSETTCAEKDLKPGTCLYYEYNAECKHGFWGWSCEFVSASAKTRKAKDVDC